MQALSSLQKSLDRITFLEFVYQAFALGFSEKWTDPKSEICEETGTSDAKAATNH